MTQGDDFVRHYSDNHAKTSGSLQQYHKYE